MSVWRVSERPSGAGLENVHFREYTFVLDIHCQQLGKMCQLEGVCAPFEFGNVHFLESVLDIHCQLLGNVGHSHRAIALSQRTVLKAAF